MSATRTAATAGLLALVAVLTAAPATAQLWPADATHLQGGPAHSGTSTETLAPPLRRSWSVPLTDPSHAVIQNGRAFVLSNVPDGSNSGSRDSVLLTAFELGTGQRLWGPVELEATDHEYYWAGHAVGSGVVVATRGRVLRAFSAADGRALWTRDFGSPHAAAPAIADDVVYAVGGRGDGVYDESRLQALDLRTGRTRWSRSVRFGDHSAPTVADGKVFLSTQCGQTYAFRTGDGSRVWKVDAASCYGGRNSVWSDGRLYTRVGDRGTVRNADTGARLGEFSSHTLPAFAGDRMFALDLDDTSFEAPSLSAFDTASGERVWRTEVADGLFSAPLVVGDHVYAGGRGTRYPDEGELHAFRRSDGRRVWSMLLRWPLEHLEEWHQSSPYDGMAASEGVLMVATAHEFVVLAPEGYAPPPPTGPTPVSEHHARLGGDAGPLGPAMSGLLPASDGAGTYTSYVGGVVYWSPGTGAHALRGAVLYRWHGLGGVRGPLR